MIGRQRSYKTMPGPLDPPEHITGQFVIDLN